MTWRLQVKIRAFENIQKLTTVIVGSATMAMVGTIVAEFIAATAGIGYSIRIALYQSDLAKILVALFLIGIGTSLYLVSLEWAGNALQSALKSELTMASSMQTMLKLCFAFISSFSFGLRAERKIRGE